MAWSKLVVGIVVTTLSLSFINLASPVEYIETPAPLFRKIGTSYFLADFPSILLDPELIVSFYTEIMVWLLGLL
jgi:hypothetical protein